MTNTLPTNAGQPPRADIIAGLAEAMGGPVATSERIAATEDALGFQPEAAPRSSRADGPYRPELAEAFRQGARELQIDALDIAPGAVVEPAEGGAFVTCRVYVSDAQRLPMPGEED